MISWTICIATTHARDGVRERLMNSLLPQVDKYKGQIEVLVFWNNFEYSLGFLRQALLDEAKGQYISFIDDDDMIADDYCDSIFPLLDGVDYVGFQVKFSNDAEEMLPVYHSLRYNDWYEDDTGYYRGVTHLNPVRTELARQSRFPVEYNMGEDHQWAVGMRDKCKTEHVIDREMYYYEHRSDDSFAKNVGFIDRQSDTPIRPKFASKNIRFHPRSTKNVNN